MGRESEVSGKAKHSEAEGIPSVKDGRQGENEKETKLKQCQRYEKGNFCFFMVLSEFT